MCCVYLVLTSKMHLVCCCTACQQNSTAMPTQTPTIAPRGTQQPTIVPTAATRIQVLITSAPQATAAAALISDSYHRHLQTTNNSVTVAYDVTNVPDTATANTIQTLLSS